MDADTRLDSMKVGQKLKIGRLFPGITNEPVIWEVIDVGTKGVTVISKYLGIMLGSYLIWKNKAGKLSIKRAT